MLEIKDLKRKDFKPEDFFRSQKAKESNIDNTPKGFSIIHALFNTANKCQEIHDRLKRLNLNYQLKINSCYRNPEVNKLVNGSPTSKHMQGTAIDIIFFNKKENKFLTSKESLDLFLKLSIKFDKILLEKNCIHIEFCPLEEKNRLLVGEAKFENGKWKVNYY